MSEQLPHRSRRVELTFAHSRASGGEDIAAVLHAAWPELDVRAKLDESGAVAEYVVVIAFDNSDLAADALFRLRDGLVDFDIPFEITRPA